MKFPRIARGFAALLLALGGIFAVAAPAHAACGDTTAEWVGSTWTGTLDGSTTFTVAFLPPVLGTQAAVTVVVLQSGAGVWVHDYDMRWSSTAVGVWQYHFEVSATGCGSSGVSGFAGAANDDLSVSHLVVGTRVT